MIRFGLLCFVASMLIFSCTDYSVEIHFDVRKKAIISCRGNRMNEVIIDGPEESITYEGADIIYFNKKSYADRTTVYGGQNNNYILKLKPNSTYTVSSYSSNGDQGPYRIILKTDQKANVIYDPRDDCR